MMPEEIELTAPAELIALKLQWEKEQRQRCTTPQEYVKKISRGGQRYYKRGPGEYYAAVMLERERIAADYKQSEAVRKELRPRKRSKSDEKWEQVWKKHEDKNYYGVRI